MGVPTKGRRRIVFRLTAPDANEVCICGDFNGWNPQKHILKRKPGGFWEKVIMLQPGRYEYKYRIDGTWQLDPVNSNRCANDYGTLNNVIVVSA
ncbi:MAG: glycogen-binding domain-containing protein [Desulfobacterales bacterium]|nr:glycogen-binding domain-containing protein [Desulfobacterales bacterium]